jgi:glycerol-3-phosphate dehydrogenase (NAD(P)+)
MRISVLGAGSWGTALAIHLSRIPSHTVCLLERTPQGAAALSSARENSGYLPSIPFPPALSVEAVSAGRVSASQMLVLAVPSTCLREAAEGLAAHIAPGTLVVCASKGLEEREGAFLTLDAVLASMLPAALHPYIVALGGPSFAREVALERPTAVVLASACEASAQAAAAAFQSGLFRCYTSTDVCGVEHGGALKNVIAIAVGISDGAGMGCNARAALITRGLGEIASIACTRGARMHTLLGLSGLGDLVLTCTSEQSRNFRVGKALGQGRALKDIMAELGQVAEGVATARAAHALALSLPSVSAPLISHVYGMLYQQRTVQEVLAAISADTEPQPEWVVGCGGGGGSSSSGAASL